MSFFLTEGMGGELLASEGAHHQFQIGDDQGHGRMLELVEEPDLPQGTWNFGEGTIHHQAFDVVSAENQQEVKDWIVGLGFTDVSEAKDRGYFFSMYCRSPSGLLVELAHGTPQGFLIDESGRRARHAHVHPAALGGPPVGDLAARADRHDRDRVGWDRGRLRAASLGPFRRASMPGGRRRDPTRPTGPWP